MAFMKFNFAPSRDSAGELTFGELGSELCDSPDKPRVVREGLKAMVAAVQQQDLVGRQTKVILSNIAVEGQISSV